MENKCNLKIKAALTPQNTLLGASGVGLLGASGLGLLGASGVGFPCLDLLFSYVFPKSLKMSDFDGSCAAEDLVLLNADPSAPVDFQHN